MGLSPEADNDAFPLPSGPNAPSETGGIQVTSEIPEILDEMAEVPSFGS